MGSVGRRGRVGFFWFRLVFSGGELVIFYFIDEKKEFKEGNDLFKVL